MSNYDYKDYEFNDLRFRYPDSAIGHDLWREFSYDFTGEFSHTGISLPKLRTPRVFVSYKSEDRKYALRIAYLCNEEGVNYWLDVLDPTLSRLTSSSQPLAIAAIIEMALLNASHVIASITPNTWTSKWVPYEFGRCKDSSVLASQASSWVAPYQSSSLPEYLYLCPRTYSEQDIRKWLSRERRNWEQRNSMTLRKPASHWSAPIPGVLP